MKIIKLSDYKIKIKATIHTPKSKEFADILHNNWPEEFDANGDKK